MSTSTMRIGSSEAGAAETSSASPVCAAKILATPSSAPPLVATWQTEARRSPVTHRALWRALSDGLLSRAPSSTANSAAPRVFDAANAAASAAAAAVAAVVMKREAKAKELRRLRERFRQHANQALAREGAHKGVRVLPSHARRQATSDASQEAPILDEDSKLLILGVPKIDETIISDGITWASLGSRTSQLEADLGVPEGERFQLGPFEPVYPVPSEALPPRVPRRVTRRSTQGERDLLSRLPVPVFRRIPEEVAYPPCVPSSDLRRRSERIIDQESPKLRSRKLGLDGDGGGGGGRSGSGSSGSSTSASRNSGGENDSGSINPYARNFAFVLSSARKARRERDRKRALKRKRKENCQLPPPPKKRSNSRASEPPSSSSSSSSPSSSSSSARAPRNTGGPSLSQELEKWRETAKRAGIARAAPRRKGKSKAERRLARALGRQRGKEA